MALYADRVQETTTTAGTITLVMGGAVPAYRTFSSAFSNGDYVRYGIANNPLAPTEWEVGEGIYTGGTVSRLTVLASSNANALVNFSAGTKYVWCDFPAAGLLALSKESLESVGLRLSLTTAVPITTSDVSAASTLYYTPYRSGCISLFYHGLWQPFVTAEISIAVTGLAAASNYDVYAYWTGSAVALEFGTAWTNDTTRAVANSLQDGVLVKSTDATRRLVGTVHTAAGTPTFYDSKQFRWVSNLYNFVRRPLLRQETSGYPSALTANTYRQANANTSNLVSYIACEAGRQVHLFVQVAGTATSSTAFASGVGVDSTTTNSAGIFGGSMLSTAGTPNCGVYDDNTALGYHLLNWLEAGGLTQTYTISAPSTVLKCGMSGYVEN